MATFCQIHRFGDKVAVYVGNGATTYMTPAEALKLAKALNATAREIKAGVRFSNSTVGTFELKLEEQPT